MAPAPRPPIICYNLTTNSNARSIPPRDRQRRRITAKRRISVENRECRISDSSNGCRTSDESLEYGVPDENREPAILTRRDREPRVSTKDLERKAAVDRRRLIEHEKRHLAMQKQLDELRAKVECVKTNHALLDETYGMSHKAAKQMQKLDEESLKLKEESIRQQSDESPVKIFSFYKPDPDNNVTVEVEDMDFFLKMEDQTMTEVNELLHKIDIVSKDLNQILQ